jgi:hypothetical protein
VEEGWEEDHQHHRGIQRHVRQARDEPKQRAADHQHDRVRDASRPRQRAEPGHGHQQSGYQELGFAHGRIIAPIARAKPILLAAAMAFLALNVWTGSPLLAVWLGSRVQGDESQPSMAAYAVVIGRSSSSAGPLPAAQADDGRLPGGDGHHADRPLTRPVAAQHARRAPELRRHPRRISGAERVVVVTVLIAAAAFEIWFFFFSGSSIGGGGGR